MISEINLKLKEFRIESKVHPLPPRKNYMNKFQIILWWFKFKLFPDKFEELTFKEWLNKPIKYVVGEPIIAYHSDCEEELKKFLDEEIKIKK